MKKNHSEEWRTLWAESNRNRLPLLFTVLVRAAIAVSFIFYICNYLSRFKDALIITLALVVVMLMIFSRRLKRRSINLPALTQETQVVLFHSDLHATLTQVAEQRQHRRGVILLIAVAEYQ